MSGFTAEQLASFKVAVAAIEKSVAGKRLDDKDADADLRKWLDGNGPPVDWAKPDRIASDEWFFVTTLYGEMTPEGQRTHIRKFFPTLFVAAAKRDMRNFVADMPAYKGLRSKWMSGRLTKMGELLRVQRKSMDQYAAELRALETKATSADPTPALDRIVKDHRATGWKTLSVFVRDCIGGNCFSIDSRVERQLEKYDLPKDERILVQLSLELKQNPRRLARMFYQEGL